MSEGDVHGARDPSASSPEPEGGSAAEILPAVYAQLHAAARRLMSNNLIGIDEVPGAIAITCGEFTLVNGHLVTTQWGFAETGCDNPGWSQDLVRT